MRNIPLIQKVVILTLLGFSRGELKACTAGWIGGTSSVWEDGANWNPNCIPSAAGDSASFNMSSNHLSPTLGSIETISHLLFNTGAVSYDISGAGLNFSGAGSSIQLLAGSHTISTPINALSSLTVNLIQNSLLYNGSGFTSSPGTTVTFSGTTGQFSTVGANFTPANITINGGIVNSELSTPDQFIQTGGIFNGLVAGPLFTDAVISGGLYHSTGANSFDSFTINNGTFQSIGIDSSAASFANVLTIHGGNFIVESANALQGLILVESALSISGGSFLLNSGALSSLGSFSISGGLVNIANGTLTGGTLQFTGGTVNLQSGLMNFSNVLMSGGTLLNHAEVDGIVSLTGGRVQGTGIFLNDFINSRGVVEPGDPVGNLSFSSNYTQNTGGTLQINFLNSNDYGSISAASVNLDGTLNLHALPGFSTSTGNLFQIVTTDPAGRVGTFTSVVETNFPSALFPRLTYGTDFVSVSFIQTLPNFVAIKELVISNINQLNFLLFKRFDQLVDPCSCSPHWDAYVGPLGSVGSVHSKEHTIGYDFYTAGALLGGDYVGRWYGFGAEIDYQRLHGGVHEHFGDFDLDQVHGSIYGIIQLFNRLYLNTIIGGGYQWDSLSRRTAFGDDLHARSNPNARLFDALGGIEFQWSCCYFNATPFISAQYIYYHIDSFRESHAAVLDLNFEKQRYESTRTSVGVIFDASYEVKGFAVVPSVNIAWQRDLNDREHTLYFLNDSPGFIKSGIHIPRFAQDTLLAGAAVEVSMNRCYSFDLSYEYEGNNRLSDHFFYFGVNAKF